jgi:putative membrane protein
MTLILRLIINAAALWCAARFIDGISYTGTWPGLLGVALVFGVVNTFIRPALRFFSFPIRVLTLGLFTLVINALMLLLTAKIAERLELAFTVRGFVPALLGAILISILSTILSTILITEDANKDDD